MLGSAKIQCRVSSDTHIVSKSVGLMFDFTENIFKCVKGIAFDNVNTFIGGIEICMIKGFSY